MGRIGVLVTEPVRMDSHNSRPQSSSTSTPTPTLFNPQHMKIFISNYEDISQHGTTGTATSSSTATYTVYPISIEYTNPNNKNIITSWQIKRRYKHFWELYQNIKNKYSEIELFEFPQKLMFNTETEKLHRKESFHIFLNLLLTLKPLPKELEHFLEIKKYLKSQLSSSSDTNMSSYEPSYSLYSRPSIDDDTLSINSDTLPTTTTTTTASKTNKITSSSSSNTVPIWTLTPIALFAYIILFSTWVGSVIWLSLKGTEQQEKLLWTNAVVLLIALFLLKQDRDIVTTYKKNTPPPPPSSSTSHQIDVPLSTPSQSIDLSSDDWVQSFNGNWRIIRQENAVESWYPMAGINFLIRPIALTVLMTLAKRITITNNILKIERSFNGKKYWKASIKIGRNKETAEIIDTDLDGVKCHFSCYLNHQDKILIFDFEPFDQEKGIRFIHQREILPNGELKMTWNGVNLGTGVKGTMTTYFVKVDENPFESIATSSSSGG